MPFPQKSGQTVDGKKRNLKYFFSEDSLKATGKYVDDSMHYEE